MKGVSCTELTASLADEDLIIFGPLSIHYYHVSVVHRFDHGQRLTIYGLEEYIGREDPNFNPPGIKKKKWGGHDRETR